MPRLIQVAPIGLLSTLVSKDGGIGPNALLDEVRPSIDLQAYYGLNVRRNRFFAFSKAVIDAGGGEGWNYANVLSASSQLTVPDGQIWRILGFNLHVTNVLGTVNVQAGWCMGDPTISGAEGISIGSATGAVTVNTRGVSGGFVTDQIWALPGSQACFFIRDWLLATNDCDVNCTLAFERFLF